MLKNILYAVLLGVGMAACLSQQDNPDDETAGEPEEFILPETTEDATALSDSTLFLVAEQRVGNTRIGMPIARMRQQVSGGLRLTDTTLNLEGAPSTAYVLRPEKEAKGLLIEQSCDGECKVWRISVLSPKYKTAKDIRVGTTYGELQQVYKIRAVTFEEGNVVAQAPDAGMSFMLDHSSLPAEELSRLNAATAPKNLPIERILVY
ncbi:hypothetical protein [Pontibacter chinhatensis]|uniref:Uncharacterized protein n=1 Tax=Pontibacter chinhatensis TaxID=1436961 RepID=A0A1I2QTS5_9BACT|nr:hypothetical protein [Pontibacter chinhatensis]SFG31430.1 hypothetical protein SAMN05421739_102124 [Pontibacter chinhatensis]